MQIEEKAKAYDEAIKRAKSKLHYPDKPCFVDVTEIFPELKESENEKVRKDIIEHLKQDIELECTLSKEKGDKWIAWLEKQGETYTKKDVDDAWLKGICDAKRELEKQGAISPIHSNSSNIGNDEQKPKEFSLEELNL